MASLLSNLLDQIDNIYKYFLANKFRDGRKNTGRIAFFYKLLQKLNNDIEEFSRIIAVEGEELNEKYDDIVFNISLLDFRKIVEHVSKFVWICFPKNFIKFQFSKYCRFQWKVFKQYQMILFKLVILFLTTYLYSQESSLVKHKKFISQEIPARNFVRTSGKQHHLKEFSPKITNRIGWINSCSFYQNCEF